MVEATGTCGRAPGGVRVLDPCGRTTRRGGPAAALGEEDRRLYEQIPGEIDYVPHPSFEAADAEEQLHAAPDVDVPRWRWHGDIPDDPSSASSRGRRLSAKEQTLLFLRYNYARFRLSRLAEAQAQRGTAARAREMVRWHGRVQRLRSDLVHTNLALVPAMAKRASYKDVELAELVSEGNLALLRAVEKFDVSRGFKFSTYGCRAILKSFQRLAAKTGRYRRQFPTEFDPDLERADYGDEHCERRRRRSLETLHDVLVQNRARLSHIERQIVWERFPITSDVKARTLAQVAVSVGLSNERVRQIQYRALRKLRHAFEARCLPA